MQSNFHSLYIPTCIKCSLFSKIWDAYLKDKKSKYLIPFNGYFKKLGIRIVLREEKSFI